jgi:SH3-like domain-containing protein
MGLRDEDRIQKQVRLILTRMKNHLRNSHKTLIVIFLIIAAFGCREPSNKHLYTAEIDSISKKWVPDGREGICNVTLHLNDQQVVVKGATNISEAKREIMAFLESKNVKFSDSLTIIPDTNIVNEPWGLIDVSVSNIRYNPNHDMEMTSQAVMGTPVKIFAEDDGWFHIQTPDSYIGWIDGDAVTTMTATKYSEWKRSSRIIYLGKTGDIFSAPDYHAIVSDIVAGVILRSEGREKGYYHVILPDGRSGYLPEKDCRDFSLWAAETKPEADKILKTGKSLMGTPYLWGGTSVKGLDCSGFVKTVYFLNGIVLARDASLQVMHGFEIKDYTNIDNLKPGDLLFFGRSKGQAMRPTHVGMYIGNTEFIHESGMVKINSLDSTRKNFSRYRHDSFLAARRIIGIDPGPGMQSIILHPWYF